MPPTRVEVTLADIAFGKRGRCYWCPVALALRRRTGRLWEVHGVHIWRGRKPAVSVPLPKKVQRWIASYDAGQRVRPFAFELALPET
jgi:hypothetical protein